MSSASAEPRRTFGALAALSLAALLASLGTSVANVALPTLATSFHASFQAVQWVVLAYLLTVTTLVVGAGRIGDMFGRRRLLVTGIALFTVASLACGAAPSLVALVCARAIQGLGAAIMMALTVAFVSDAVPAARRGSAMGLLGAMSAVGTALGPPAGGFLLTTSGWRAVFLLNVPLGAAAVLVAHRSLRADARTLPMSRLEFDYAGTALLAATLGAYALAMTVGRGHVGVPNIALLLAAAIGVAAFARTEQRARSPLVQLSLLRDSALVASLLANALVSTVMMATLVVGPFHLSRALGLSSFHVGLAMAVGPVITAVVGVPAGRLADRYGTRPVIGTGLTAMVIGATLVVGTPIAVGVWSYVAPIAVVTAGYALFQTANNAAVMADVVAEHRGVVAGLLGLSRNLGLVTGGSAMGALFAAAAHATDPSTAAPSALAVGTRMTFAVAAALTLGALIVILSFTDPRGKAWVAMGRSR